MNDTTARQDKLAKDYARRAEYVRDAGGKVEINYGLPYVAVTCPDYTEYFFQGDEADELLARCPDWLHPEIWLLVDSQDW